MASGFDDPEGDPGPLDAQIAHLSSHASTLKTKATALSSGFDHALSTWKAPRAAAFRSAGEGIDLWTSQAYQGLTKAVDALGTYSGQLRTAKKRIEELRDQADESRRRTAQATADLPADGPDAIRKSRAVDAEVERLREEADQVHRQLSRHAESAASALDALVNQAVPGGAKLRPDDLRRRVDDLTGAAAAQRALARGDLTAGEAWKALGNAGRVAPPAQWRDWARANGMTLPEPFDATRALALKSRLDNALSKASNDPAARAKLVRDFADRLDPADLTMLSVLDPARVGNLDGMPNHARYFANKINLSHALDTEQDRLDGWQPPPSKKDDAYADYSRLKGRISMMGKLLGGDQIGMSSGPHQVLAFEPPKYGSGNHPLDDGRLAVAVGDLDRAKHVGVVVPGITNRIDNFGGTLDKAYSTQDKAGRSSATVAWLGYDAPEFQDAVLTEDAERGGKALHDFMAGLQRAKGSDLTIMAHSYGTLVTSKALQLGSAKDPLPDRVVLFGSPGLGRNVKSAADLHLPDDFPIYALRAPGDPIAITAAHGIDPVDLPGITRLDTDWHGEEDVNGHSQYTDQGSDSLWNISQVLKGDLTHLQRGGSPLDAGLLGPWNQNLRNLVHELNGKVPADVQSTFIAGLESDAQRLAEGHNFDFDDVPRLHLLLLESAHDADLEKFLTHAEVEQLMIDAGFAKTAGQVAGRETKRFFDRLDVADDWRIPIPNTPFQVPVPDGLNEAVGALAGAETTFLTEHVSETVLRNLPSLNLVLGYADVLAFEAMTAKTLFHAGQAIPGLVEDGYRATRDFGKDVADRAHDFATDTKDAAVNTAKKFIPGI